VRIFQQPIRLNGPPPPPDVAALQADLDAAYERIRQLTGDVDAAAARRRAALAEQRATYDSILAQVREELLDTLRERDQLRERLAGPSAVVEETSESRWRRLALLQKETLKRYEERLARYEGRPSQRQQTNDSRAVHPGSAAWTRRLL